MRNRKVYIYKITNPKDKVYIGSTVDIKDRIYRYKTGRVKSQVKIYNSILKYGFDNHNFEIIFECDESNRNYYEAYYGEKFDVIGKNGLNLLLPNSNESYPCMSLETKIKIGLAHKGKKISEEQKISMAYNLKKYRENNPHPSLNRPPWNKGKEFLKGELNPMFGVKRTDEWKEKQSIILKQVAKKGIDNSKSKVVLDLQTGIFFYSCKEVSECYNIKYSSLKSHINKSKKPRFIYI
jgi:group I intron endonuclease